jgi:K+-sensing histidine kinase KdpD
MKVSSLLLVGADSAVAATTREAAALELPGADVPELKSVADALARPPAAGPELMVLSEPDLSAANAAATAVDSAGSLRWTMVVIGQEPVEAAAVAATVPRDEWTVGIARRVLRSAARLHELARENAQLRGDLSTVGRRISHDLRAPLTGIYSATDAINEIGSGTAGDPQPFTRSISSSADELVDLIDRVSFILKASAEPAVKEPALMGEIVFASLQRLEKITTRKGAVIAQPSKWPVVSGLPAALDIIWTNLISNALRHAGDKPRIELGWQEVDREFVFWVQDEGPGVRADRVSRLFQPFNLLHRLNAARGIGLSVVQRLTQLHDGRCGYEPRPSGGARFYFTLPVGAQPSATPGR